MKNPRLLCAVARMADLCFKNFPGLGYGGYAPLHGNDFEIRILAQPQPPVAIPFSSTS